LHAFKDRLVALQVAKAESEALLQDAMWKEKSARAAREAALQELETSASRILALEDQLNGTERLLKRRDAELKALQSRPTAAPEPPVKKSPVGAPDQRMLEEELRKTTELLKSKESALVELEKTLAQRIDDLEDQLKSGEKLQKERAGELQALKAELLNAQVAKQDAENLRAADLTKQRDALAAKDAAINELEQALTAKIRALENQASGHQELFESRGAELEALKSQMTIVTARLANLAAAKKHADNLLQQELQQKADLLQSKDRAFKDLQQRSTAHIRSLETRLVDQEQRAQERDQELAHLKNQLAEIGAVKNRTETSLADELAREKQEVAAKDAAMRELERNYLAKIDSLNTQLREKQESWQSRSTELEAFRSEINVLTARLGDVESAKERVEALLQQELKNGAEALQAKDASLKEVQTKLTARVRQLEDQITEKDAILAQSHTELNALQAQLTHAQSSSKQTEELIRQELKEKTASLRAGELSREKQALAAKDAAIKELEQELTAKIRALETQVSDHQQLSQSRGTELEALRTEMNVVAARLANVSAAKEHADNLLRQELQQKAELLQSKDKAFQELQEQSTAGIRSLEGRLAEEEKRREERDQELAQLKSQLAEVGAIKDRAESSLADELRKEKQELAAKDAAMRELERNYVTQIDSLNAQLRENQELWQSRGSELEGFRSELNVVAARLTEMESAKERVETLLQEELKKRAEVLQAKDLGFKEAQSKLAAAVSSLESRLAEKEAVLAQRHAELDAVGAQLANMQASSKEKEERLRQELREKAEVLQGKDLTMKELQETLAKLAAAAKNEISERDRLLKSRAEELERLRSKVDVLDAQLKQVTMAAASREEPPLDEAANEAINKKLEESSKKILTLESSLREKEDLLKTHDGKIERLETELKEKRTELAKHEIAVWQAYEKRALWKQRLAKFGISMKER
jgi:chromosome segregation ATPase